MFLSKIKNALYIGINKNNDEMYIESVKVDEKQGESLVDKAKRIIFTNKPPPKISDKPDWYQCKICAYSTICHDDKFPLANCRTCAFSVLGTKWECSLNKRVLSLEDQLAGCKKHCFNPDILPLKFEFSYKKVDLEGVPFIAYKVDGKDLINGMLHVQSSELSLNPDILQDKNVKKFKSIWPRGSVKEIKNGLT